jgi:HPt (histidine-containing phosphotransfer) domain-containing protein
MDEKDPGGRDRFAEALPVLDGPTAERLLHLARTVAFQDENVLVELMRIFERDAARYLASIDDAVARRDIDAASREIHALKGASLSVGAARVSAALVTLEGLVRSKRGSPAVLFDEIRRARPAIDEYVAESLRALFVLSGHSP